jgi:hypothetical protein
VKTIDDFANALTKTEGKPGDLNYRNNNPGNMRPPGGKPNFWSGQTGVDSKGFAIFKSWSDGWAALKHQLALDASRGFSVLELSRKWLGMDPKGNSNITDQGDAYAKAQSIAQELGADINDSLKSIFG